MNLTKVADALRALADAIVDSDPAAVTPAQAAAPAQRRARASAPAPADAAAKAAAAPPAVTAAPVTAPAAAQPATIPPPTTIKQAADELVKLVQDPQRGGYEAAKALLTKFGVAQLAQLAPAKLADFMAECKATGVKSAAPAQAQPDLLG